jgi:hypothetical protein
VGAAIHGDVVWWLITQDNYQAFSLQYARNGIQKKTYCAIEITNSAVLWKQKNVVEMQRWFCACFGTW